MNPVGKARDAKAVSELFEKSVGNGCFVFGVMR